MIYLAITAAVLALLWLQTGAAVFLVAVAKGVVPADALTFCLAFWPAMLYVGASEPPPPKNENEASHRPGSEVMIR